MNACICIAVVHHMSTRARRLQALKEITRVLRPGGLALVTVWAMEQEHKKEKSKYILKKGETRKDNTNCPMCARDALTDETTRFTNSGNDEESRKCEPSNDAREDKREESIIDNDDKREGTTRETKSQSGLCTNPSVRIPYDRDHDHGNSSDLESKLADNSGVRSKVADDNDVRSRMDEDNDVRSRTYDKSRVSTEIQQEEQASCNAGHDRPSLRTEATNSLQQGAADGKINNDEHSAETPPGETILVHKNRTQFEQQDLLVPWHLRGQASKGQVSKNPENLGDDSKSTAKEKVFFRYYHVFVKGEMEELCQTIEGVRVKETYYDQGNWCVIFQKL
eukprot:XP_792844.3 PREDICTED: alkylated DNA repair protein alkB homolog 8-like [Strongylocentrotus purpuratus]